MRQPGGSEWSRKTAKRFSSSPSYPLDMSSACSRCLAGPRPTEKGPFVPPHACIDGLHQVELNFGTPLSTAKERDNRVSATQRTQRNATAIQTGVGKWHSRSVGSRMAFSQRLCVSQRISMFLVMLHGAVVRCIRVNTLIPSRTHSRSTRQKEE